MNEEDRKATADTLLDSSEGLSLLERDDPLNNEGSEDGLYIPPATQDPAKIFDLDGLTYRAGVFHLANI